MSLNQEKFSNLNAKRKTTEQQISNLLSQLNSFGMDALKQQAYMRKNPDANGADELLAVVGVSLPSIITSFEEVKSKLEDLVAVKEGLMTVDDMIAKHSINLTEFSDSLL